MKYSSVAFAAFAALLLISSTRVEQNMVIMEFDWWDEWLYQVSRLSYILYPGLKIPHLHQERSGQVSVFGDACGVIVEDSLYRIFNPYIQRNIASIHKEYRVSY